MMAATARPPLSGLRDIAERYDGFIFDVWGTVYDGGQVFPEAPPVFERLRELGKRIVFLSNSPQLPAVVAERLERIGIPPALHDGIVTSGGETHRQLTHPTLAGMERFNGPVYQTGPDRFPDTLPKQLFPTVGTVAEAGWILNAGPNLPPDTLALYEERLAEGAARHLPMLCANPDRVVLQGSERHICAGALAERYEALGGTVIHIGKPHPMVFERCGAVLGIAEPAQILMVGDNFETDIRGANRFGCGSLLIASGVHGLATPDGGIRSDALGDLEASLRAHPDHLIDRLRW